MKYVTVYGKICKDKISTRRRKYSLKRSTCFTEPVYGWFQIQLVGHKWKLIRILKKQDAEVYPDWIE